MKNLLVIASLSVGVLCFMSCSKDKDCVCVYTSSENGTVVNSSTSSSSYGSGVPGPAGSLGDKESCDFEDSYYSYTSNGVTYEDRTECELE